MRGPQPLSQIAQEKLSTIDTSSVKGYVQPVAPVVASVSSYLGSWLGGDQTTAAPPSQYGAGASAGAGGAAEARKEEGTDWSQWGWGAEKDKAEPAVAPPAAKPASNGGDDGWGDWGGAEEQQGSAKPRRPATGKRE